MTTSRFSATTRKDRLKTRATPLPKNGAVIYCRVSTKDQLDGYSIETQEDACKAYCDKNKYAILEVFQEAASAKTTERPEFQRMLLYCSKNQRYIGAVIVYAASRFARNAGDHQNVRKTLDQSGIKLLSVTESFDGSPMGKMMETLLSAYAQLDNDVRSERTIAGMMTAMKNGNNVHKAPIGYLNSDAPGGLSHDPKRAELIRTAFEVYAGGKDTKNAVLARVTALGLTNPKTSQPISAQTFDKVLRNPKYAGWITGSKWGIEKRGKFAPIITDELFERVAARLGGNSPARQARSRENEAFPLKVFVRCAACGTGLAGSFSTGRNGKKYGHYCCHKKGCRGVKFSQEDLHSHFVSLLHSLFPRPAFIPLFMQVVKAVWRQKVGDQTRQAQLVQHQIKELEDRRQKIIDLRIDSQMDQQTYEEQIGKVGTRLEAVRSAIGNALIAEQELDFLLEFAEWTSVLGKSGPVALG